jgi:hypothetical protein
VAGHPRLVRAHTFGKDLECCFRATYLDMFVLVLRTSAALLYSPPLLWRCKAGQKTDALLCEIWSSSYPSYSSSWRGCASTLPFIRGGKAGLGEYYDLGRQSNKEDRQPQDCRYYQIETGLAHLKSREEHYTVLWGLCMILIGLD